MQTDWSKIIPDPKNSTNTIRDQKNERYNLKKNKRVLLKERDFIITKDSFRNRVLANLKQEKLGFYLTRKVGN